MNGSWWEEGSTCSNAMAHSGKKGALTVMNDAQWEKREHWQ
jgi:hypothetical protein